MRASAIREAGREVVQGCLFERWHGMNVRQGADCEADVGARKGVRLTAWAGRPDVSVHISGYLGARRVTFEY